MVDWYILDDHGNPVPERDLSRWGAWFESAPNRVLERDHLPGDVLVSTVFLGIDHNFSDRGSPLLWETMILGGPHNGYCQRYASRKAALAGHQTGVEIARGKPMSFMT
jgi:hypothetical protein